MILIIDNTKNLKEAYMTPKLLKLLEDNNYEYIVASDRTEVNRILKERKNEIKCAILSGGPLCLSEELTISSINKNIAVLMMDIPILGICFGFQIIAASYGGKIDGMENIHHGKKEMLITKESILFNEQKKNFIAFESHRDKLVEVPPDFEIIAKSSDNIIQGIENKKLKRWGLQFHPEGLKETNNIIFNFLKYNNINYK
jgi:anthranilate/para-aminobenzoate synthase component II